MRFSVLALLLLAFPRPAAAAGADEIRALEAQIAVALEAHGCAIACDALASMTRAADRLCALDPGPRCEDARARVRDAQRRVLEACPECAVIGGSLAPPVQANKDGRPATPSALPLPPPPAAEAEVVGRRRGGCAGCVVGGDGGVPAEALLAGLGILAALARRRRPR